MTETSLSGESPQKVQNALAAAGVQTTVKEMPASTRTAKEAAATIGCAVAQIAKSLVFRASATDRAILVIASGTNRVNETLLAQLVDEPIERATPEFVRERTGFVIGGVPPIGHPSALPIWMDRDLLQFETSMGGRWNPVRGVRDQASGSGAHYRRNGCGCKVQMKVVLVNPPKSRHDLEELAPPLGLLRLARVAHNLGAIAYVEDYNLLWHLDPHLQSSFYTTAVRGCWIWTPTFTDSHRWPWIPICA